MSVLNEVPKVFRPKSRRRLEKDCMIPGCSSEATRDRKNAIIINGRTLGYCCAKHGEERRRVREPHLVRPLDNFGGNCPA